MYILGSLQSGVKYNSHKIHIIFKFLSSKGFTLKNLFRKIDRDS